MGPTPNTLCRIPLRYADWVRLDYYRRERVLASRAGACDELCIPKKASAHSFGIRRIIRRPRGRRKLPRSRHPIPYDKPDVVVATKIEYIRSALLHFLLQESAYAHWVDRGRPPFDALTDWLWAEESVLDLGE